MKPRSEFWAGIDGNVGLVLRGPLFELDVLVSEIEKLLSDHGIKLIYKKASASRLRILEENGGAGE